MAMSTQVVNASLSIEVENGVDAAGDPKYKKKTFSGLKTDANTQNVYDVALAIKDVLSENCGNTYINVTSVLSNS